MRVSFSSSSRVHEVPDRRLHETYRETGRFVAAQHVVFVLMHLMRHVYGVCIACSQTNAILSHHTSVRRFDVWISEKRVREWFLMFFLWYTQKSKTLSMQSWGRSRSQRKKSCSKTTLLLPLTQPSSPSYSSYSQNSCQITGPESSHRTTMGRSWERRKERKQGQV